MAAKHPQSRRIVQVQARYDGSLVALDSEGGLWQSRRHPGARIDDYANLLWDRLPGLPQDEPER